MTQTIDTNQIPTVLAELEDAFYDIPFENSDFQNSMFVVAAQQTPARAFRAIGLRMFAKIRAIKELMYARQIEDVDILEKQELINSESTNRFARMRAEIEINKLQDQRSWTDKLLNDALKELGCLYAEFKKLPLITREQFEAEERLHFQLKLERQLQGVVGASESLSNMNNDVLILEQLAQDASLLASFQEHANQALQAGMKETERMLTKKIYT